MSSPHKEVPRLEPHEAKMPGVISLVRTRWLPFERAAASYFITLHKFGYSSPIPYSTPPFCPDYVVSSPKPWFLGRCSPYSHLAAFLSLPVEPRSLNRAHTSRYCCTANDPHGSAMISCSENPKEQKNTLKPTGHIILCMCLSVIWFINHLRTEIHMQMFQTFPKSHLVKDTTAQRQRGSPKSWNSAATQSGKGDQRGIQSHATLEVQQIKRNASHQILDVPTQALSGRQKIIPFQVHIKHPHGNQVWSQICVL